MQRVPSAGYRIVGLPVMGFQRKITSKTLIILWKLWKSLRLPAKVIREFKPQVAVGVGGYASGPVLRVAARKVFQPCCRDKIPMQG